MSALKCDGITMYSTKFVQKTYYDYHIVILYEKKNVELVKSHMNRYWYGWERNISIIRGEVDSPSNSSASPPQSWYSDLLVDELDGEEEDTDLLPLAKKLRA